MKDKALSLFAYNRPDHLRRVLDRLYEDDLQEFDIYIFQDGPQTNDDRRKTRAVSELIASHPMLKDAEKIIQSSNIGLANSVFQGLNLLFEKYEKAVILEDDILIRKGFIPFLSRALDIYNVNEKVAGVTGFSYFHSPLEENYFLPIGSSWGWATWRRVWQGIKNDPHYYLKQINDRNLKDQFNFGQYPYYSMLLNTCQGKHDSWAIQFYTHFFLKEQYFLFPSVGLCENIGFDGTGRHTVKSQEVFNSQDQTHNLDTNYPNPELNSKIVKNIQKRLKKLAGNKSWSAKFKMKLNALIK